MIRAEVMAVQQSKNVGELPSDIKQIITEMERSQVDWSSVIRRVVGGDQPEDYTYRRLIEERYIAWIYTIQAH